jgi:hypothetical protein
VLWRKGARGAGISKCRRGEITGKAISSATVEKAKPLHTKTISGRVRRLEESFAPQENEEVGRLVTLLRERRRRRLEASGEPYEVRSCEALTDDQNRPLSIADILRMGRRRVAVPNEQPPG